MHSPEHDMDDPYSGPFVAVARRDLGNETDHQAMPHEQLRYELGPSRGRFSSAVPSILRVYRPHTCAGMLSTN